MRCPKCEADKWYEVATHDPWSGRPVIACKICGEYADPEALRRENAHDVIAARWRSTGSVKGRLTRGPLRARFSER